MRIECLGGRYIGGCRGGDDTRQLISWLQLQVTLYTVYKPLLINVRVRHRRQYVALSLTIPSSLIKSSVTKLLNVTS